MDLKPKGGGVSFGGGGKVDLCTIPHGAFGPRGASSIAINWDRLTEI